MGRIFKDTCEEANLNFICPVYLLTHFNAAVEAIPSTGGLGFRFKLLLLSKFDVFCPFIVDTPTKFTILFLVNLTRK